MQVALIKTGAMGDVVRTTALLPGLKRLGGEVSVTWVTSERALDLVRHHPGVDRAVTIEEPEDAAWRDDRYDWVISLDDETRECALASRMSVGGARLSGAYLGADGQRRYTEDLEPWFGMGILRPVERGGLAAANSAKKANTRSVATLFYESLGLPTPIGRPLVPIPEVEAASASAWLRSAGIEKRRPLVGMNTGAGGRWRFKSWGEDQSAELARRLVEEAGVGAVVVLGGEAEGPRNARIVTLADRDEVIEGPGTPTVLEFAALVARLDLLVTSDSLALHLAVAGGVPLVSFFGPTSAAEIELYGQGEKVVTPLSCRCCYLTDCDVRPHCMASITVPMLFEAVRRRLDG